MSCLRRRGLRIQLNQDTPAPHQDTRALMTAGADIVADQPLLPRESDMQQSPETLAFNGSAARTWEPKRLRLRLLHVAGRLVTTGRARPVGGHGPGLIIDGHARLHACRTGPGPRYPRQTWAWIAHVSTPSLWLRRERR